MGSPNGIEADILYWDIMVSEFKLQSNYYVHFWTNIFEKGIISHPAKG